jgi:hypothetical protein
MICLMPGCQTTAGCICVFGKTPRMHATVVHQCPRCDAVAEQWWSYCAMCGYHIASGALTSCDQRMTP